MHKCRFGQGTESFQVLQNPEPTTLEPSTTFLGTPFKQNQLDLEEVL